jgi:ATP-dependent Clp protease ATP-binding subunit ClpA
MMTTGISASSVQHYACDLLAMDSSIAHILKDHSQIPVVIDTLCRKLKHHVSLQGITSEKIQLAFLQSIAYHLTSIRMPNTLRDIGFIYINIQHLLLSGESSEKIAADFYSFCSNLQVTYKKIILAINHCNIENPLTKIITTLSMNEAWRIISLNHQPDYCTPFNLKEPSDAQLLALLKTYKSELEDYHHVSIPDETFSSALSMTTHYLTTQSCFDKALELLDSASSRASSSENLNFPGQTNSVSNATLAQVISSWTQIPLNNLHNNSFQSSKFIDALQRRVFGQEAAITSLSSTLQHAYIKLQKKTGPLCNFLLVGPDEVGKTTAAYSMAEHLFGNRNALFTMDLNVAHTSLTDIKVNNDVHHDISLFQAIQQTPYAIFLIANIQQTAIPTLTLLKSIFAHGYALDNAGNKYDFKHAIFVLTTTLGAERIAALTQMPTIVETNKSLDLMQLVLSEHSTDAGHHLNPHVSFQELSEELIPTLENYFSATLLQDLYIIPFSPLDYLALEKIMRSQVKLLAQHLEAQFGIELHYAPEIIKFLAHEAFWRKPQTKPIQKLLEQHLYSTVANELLMHAENKNRPKRLLIQLNEDGQLLRCETGSHLSSVF